MDVVFENMYLLILCTILFLVVYAALLNVYFIHKNGFYVSVNCWFCNKNSKVLYKKRNSFDCPYCTQYNGFTENGDYNRVIEAQHNLFLNNTNKIFIEKPVHSTPNTSNGLCESCNKNQQLRVLQLASYEPLNHKNYEKEIEHFEKQLEKTYKLCNICSKTVKSTIRKQNAWIFGNRLKNLKSPIIKGPFNFKPNKQSQGFKEDSKFYYKISVTRCVLLILSAFNLVVLCGFDSFIPKSLLSEVSLPGNVIFSKVYIKMYNIVKTKLGHTFLITYLSKSLLVQDINILTASMLGFIIEFLFTFLENNNTFFGKLSKLLSWIILGLTSAVFFKSDISVYISTLQIFCSLWLVYSNCTSCINFKRKQPKNFTLKRLRKSHKEKDYSDNEESSSESLDDSGVSYRTAATKRSPITANSFKNFNGSFKSVKSTKTAPLNSTFIHNNEYTARNLELNKHFNELNLGAFEANRPMSCQGYQSPSSPNPFLNRPQSSNVVYNNYGVAYNSPSTSFPMQTSQTGLFKLQSPQTNFGHLANSSFIDNQSRFLNHTHTMSPRSDRFERMSVQTEPYSLKSNIPLPFNSVQNSPFVLQNTSAVSPKDTNSVHSYKIAPQPPTYSLRSKSSQNMSSYSQNPHQTQLNSSFRPLSPSIALERPSRNLLSPSKFNNIKTFYSDAKENENFSLYLHSKNDPQSSFWPNMNGRLHQRFVVNTVPDVQCTSPLNGTYSVGNADKRSSSSSSGFISNADSGRIHTRSLPNSRDHSPDRNSLLSEPAYHFKID